jgi:hypothetical protein
MIDSAEELARQCNEAHAEGADFPTIWRTLLSTHPWICGIPRQARRDGEPVLEAGLVTGQSLLFGSDGFTLR